MSLKLENDILQLKNKMEDYRKELNLLTGNADACYKNEKILELSTALDRMIVEYMKVIYSAEK